jgi:nucleotide-binding universal stress UspA family protein
MHGCESPLLIVPSVAGTFVPSKIGKIVVPLDGSKTSERIVPYAARVASRCGSELILTHVIEDFRAEVPYSPEIEQVLERRERELGESIGLRAREVKARFVLQHGRMPDAALELSLKEKADLFVLAAHGYGALPRLLLGSGASKLARRSSIPILLVKQGVLEAMDRPPRLP